MSTYTDEQNKTNMKKMKMIISELPDYVTDYFSARRSNTTSRTCLSYAYDIRNFFIWLKSNISELKDIRMKDISLDIIGKITARDIEEYIFYLQTDAENINHTAGIERKLSTLSAFFDYLYRLDLISNNPCDKVMKPKGIKDKRIIKMSTDEVKAFLNAIEFGSPSFSSHQRAYLEKTRVRDLAIATTFLGTGIRVSECVGLDIQDLDFKNNRIKVTRKGGKIQNVPISDEVSEALKNYLLERRKIETNSEALFLSSKNTRISIGAVENLINKYAEAVGTTYRITPHKLRKTYGTTLYEETGDIYLVASALGHENINTTKEHYAKQDEKRLQEARNTVKLR